MTTRFSTALPLLFASSLLSSVAFAGEGDKPVVGVGGTMYAHYGYDLTEGAEGANAFDIDRLYVEAKTQLEGPYSFRFTLDVGREKEQDIELMDAAGATYEVGVPEDPKIRVFLKYAYLEYKTPIEGLKLRAGAAPTGFVGFYDNFWGQRFTTKAFTDEFKVLDSSDIGIHFMGTHAEKMVDWQLSLMNGEGYGSPEENSGKTAQVRLTLDPLKDGKSGKLPISGFASYEAVPDGDPVLVYVGALGYDMKYFLVWGEYVGQSQGEAAGSGFSGTVMGKVPDMFNVYARVDRWDGDSSAEDDSTMRMIGGLSRKLVKGVIVAGQYERTTEEAAPDMPEHGVFLRMEAKY